MAAAMTLPTTYDDTHDDHATSAHHGDPWDHLWRLIRDEREDLLVVAACAAGIGVFSLAVPVAVSALVNTVAFGVMLQPLAVLTLLVVTCLAFEGVLSGLQFHVVELVQRRLFARAAVDLAHRLPRVDAQALSLAGGPRLVHRFFDVLTAQKALAGLLLDGLSVALQTVAGAALLAFYHPALLAFDLVLVGAVATVLGPLGRGAVARSLAESRAKYDAAAWLDDLARSPSAFRDAAARRLAVSGLEARVRGYLGARDAHYRVVLRQHLASHAFKALLSVGLLAGGGYLVIRRELTLGQLAAAELIVSAVVGAMAKFGKQLDACYDLVTALDKVSHVRELPLERVEGAAPPESPRGAALTLERVSCGPLRDVDLALRPGARSALLGDGGGGKSTLAALLRALRAPVAGVLRLDGADLRELSPESLREVVAVAGEAEVFAGSVADNVAAGRDAVSADRVRAALRAVGLSDDVAALPEGARTSLASGGAALSSSQRARLTLARAMAGAPRLLVVDGALDALDGDALRTTLAALLDPEAPWTLLVLTCRDDVAMCFGDAYTLSGGALRPASRSAGVSL